MALKDVGAWVHAHRLPIFVSLVLVAEIVLLAFGLRLALVVNVLAAALLWARSNRR